MSQHEDLPLFRWTPPSVEVIPFPCARRVGKIRRTAQMLNETTKRGADAYWHRAISDLRRQMERAGVPADRVEFELRSFFDAVQIELRRLPDIPCRGGGDAA